MSDLVPALTVAAAVSSAVLTGVLFAFSTSVMPALARRPASEAMAAMQAMNRTILNPLFGLLFGGSALLCLAVAVTAPFTDDTAGAGWRLAGGVLYVVGVTVETMAVNVPMNDRLDAADPTTPDGAGRVGRVPAEVDPVEQRALVPRRRGRHPARRVAGRVNGDRRRTRDRPGRPWRRRAPAQPVSLSGSSGISGPRSRPRCTARVTAPVPKRDRRSSRAASRVPAVVRSNGSASCTVSSSARLDTATPTRVIPW